MSVAYLTKTYRFNAGHRLHDPRRDEEWNRRVFGKCSYPGGHGHNYTLEVTLRGAPDADTGFVAREEEIDAAVALEVMERIDHRNLNDVLPSDLGPAPTTEVLIAELWSLLEPHFRGKAKLFRLHIRETSKNSCEYFGPAGGG